jgi:hypothetical protein
LLRCRRRLLSDTPGIRHTRGSQINFLADRQFPKGRLRECRFRRMR